MAPNRFDEDASYRWQDVERRTTMQQCIHSSIELIQVQQDLLDRQLKYHYLVADPNVRKPRRMSRTGFISSVRSFFAPRAVLSQDRGV